MLHSYLTLKVLAEISVALRIFLTREQRLFILPEEFFFSKDTACPAVLFIFADDNSFFFFFTQKGLREMDTLGYFLYSVSKTFEEENVCSDRSGANSFRLD